MLYKRKEKKHINEKESNFVTFLYTKRLGHILLTVLNKKFCSKVISLFMKTPISKLMIKNVIKKNSIDMNEFEEKKYWNFNSFFNRRLKKGVRKLSKDKDILVSPCDAKLSIYEIDEKLTMNIKHNDYTIKSLLKDDDIAKEYNKGLCLVFRLGIDDYHYYHYIDDGKILKSKKVKGVLHSVRSVALENYKLFAENNREWSLLKTKSFDDVIYMEVGALGVGKIVNYDIKSFHRGDEKGFFKFGGSTIILLFKKNTIKIDKDILDETKKGNEVQVKLFEKIGLKK